MSLRIGVAPPMATPDGLSPRLSAPSWRKMPLVRQGLPDDPADRIRTFGGPALSDIDFAKERPASWACRSDGSSPRAAVSGVWVSEADQEDDR